MWAQILRVILNHPIAFIASSAVLVILGDKVDLARIQTPPTRPVSPSPIVSLSSLSSELPFAEPEEFRSNTLPQVCGSLEWFDLAAATPNQTDINDYQQNQDSSSNVSYSWPEDMPVEDEPSNDDLNEDSEALQGQGQSEFNGEFEDSTITLSSIVPPSTTSGVARTGNVCFIPYFGDYCFGDGQLDQSKLESKSDAASSNEDQSESPDAPAWDAFYGGTPSEDQPWMAGFFYLGLPLGLWMICFLKIKYNREPKPSCHDSFDQVLEENDVLLLTSRLDTLVEKHETANQKRAEEIKTMGEQANQALVKGEKEKKELIKGHLEDKKTLRRRHLQETETLRKRIETLEEEKETLKEKLEEISGRVRSTSRPELDEGNEDVEKLKEELASLRAENKALSTRLDRESENDTELRGLLDTAKAHAERLKGSLAKKEQDIREAHEAKFQAITEASEARKEAKTSRATAEAAQLELDESWATAEAAQQELDAKRAELESVQVELAKIKEDAEASRSETRIAMDGEKAALSKIASLEDALAESGEERENVQKEANETIADLKSKLKVLGEALADSEEKTASVQKEADAALANQDSQLNDLREALAKSEEKTATVQEEANATIAALEAKLKVLGEALADSQKKTAKLESDLKVEQVVNDQFAFLYEQTLALQGGAQLGSTQPNFGVSENSSAPVQPSGEAPVPTPVAEPQQSPAEDGLVPSSAPAAPSNPSGQSSSEPLPFTMADPSTTSPAQPSEEAAVPTPVAEPQPSPAEDGLVPSSASVAMSNPSGQSSTEPLPFTMADPSTTSFPAQPSGEPAVPTPVAEPQSSPAEDGLVHSSSPATTSNTSGQSWLKVQPFTMVVPRATSFPEYKPGLLNISYGKEPTGLAQQGFDAAASYGGIDNSMEVSDSTPSTTSSGSIFGPGPATLPTPLDAPNLGPTAAPIEGPAVISQQTGAPTLDLQQLANLMTFLQTGVVYQPSQGPGLDGAASFVGQDPNAVASQNMGAVRSYGEGYNSGLNSMYTESSTTSSMASFGYNAPAANPPMAVDDTYGATGNTATNTALGNPAPIGQHFAHDPYSTAVYTSHPAMAEAGPLPAQSQYSTFTGVSSTMNQQWGPLQQPLDPGYGQSLGQEQSFDSAAVPQTPMYQNNQQPFWEGQPAAQQNQNLFWQQDHGAYTNAPQNPGNFLGSSQTYNFQSTPQTVPHPDNIAVQPNSSTMQSTSGPLTQSDPATISPQVFFNAARDARYFTGNAPFAMGTSPYYASAPPPTSYAPLAAPPVNQISETTPIDSSQTENWSVQHSAPVAENNYTQPAYNGPPGDDEVSLGENDGDEDWRECHASLSGFRESAPSPAYESTVPAGQEPMEGDWDKFEDDLDSYSDQGTGDVIIPISPPLNHVSEDDVPPAAGDTPRPIKRLPRSLRRAQVNEAEQFPNGTPVAVEAAADADDSSSGAWGAADDDQEPPTPPTTESGERSIRPLPKSRRRQATSQMSVGN